MMFVQVACYLFQASNDVRLPLESFEPFIQMPVRSMQYAHVIFSPLALICQYLIIRRLGGIIATLWTQYRFSGIHSPDREWDSQVHWFAKVILNNQFLVE